jgi:hypothetical protein
VIARARRCRRSRPIAHLDTKLFVAATARVLYCWILDPDLLDKSYLTFLNRRVLTACSPRAHRVLIACSPRAHRVLTARRAHES